MWFRVELHKDGSVASCEQVAASIISSRLVRFVEADTKAEAIRSAQLWYQRTRENARVYDTKRSQRLRASGLCVQCAKRPRLENLGTCDVCRAKQRERYRARRDGAAFRAQAHSPEEALVRRQEALRAHDLRYGETPKRAYAKALQDALEAFDAKPEGYRSWLVAKLKDLGIRANAKAAAEPFAFEAAAE